MARIAIRMLVASIVAGAACTTRPDFLKDSPTSHWRPDDDERAKAMAKVNLKPEFARAIDPKLEFTRLQYPDTYAPEVGFSNGFPVRSVFASRLLDSGRRWRRGKFRIPTALRSHNA
jgi:hypothetical protein